MFESMYTTQPAESLMGIALRALGAADRWTEIRDLNEDRFPDMGPHDYYPVGTELKLPAKAPLINPLFAGVPQRKLDDLMSDGFVITGYAIEKPFEGEAPRRGFITTGGLVGWWTPNSQADLNKLDTEDAKAVASAPKVVATAPKKIYLVIGEDCDPEADFNVLDRGMDLDSVTWCADQVDGNSIAYVRADTVDDVLAVKDPEWALVHQQLAEKTLECVRAWQRYEMANRMSVGLQEERANLVAALREVSGAITVGPVTGSSAEVTPKTTIESAINLAPRGLDTADRVRFYEHDFYVLSNFSAFSLMWKGYRFDTSEAAYHWEKFPDEGGVRYAIQTAISAHDAYKVAEEYKPTRRVDWDAVKVDIMRQILREKVRQHRYVKQKLLATGERELVEDSWRDDFWGWGENQDGQNMLGKLWMEVRSELRTKQGEAK